LPLVNLKGGHVNQSQTVNELMKSGWQKDHERSGFVHLFKRDRSPGKNFLCPEYNEITVFPNGRYALGDFEKWAKIRKRNKRRI